MTINDQGTIHSHPPTYSESTARNLPKSHARLHIFMNHLHGPLLIWALISLHTSYLRLVKTYLHNKALHPSWYPMNKVKPRCGVEKNVGEIRQATDTSEIKKK
jgi:hypothetical protein